jgi:hypothetical protein
MNDNFEVFVAEMGEYCLTNEIYEQLLAYSELAHQLPYEPAEINRLVESQIGVAVFARMLEERLQVAAGLTELARQRNLL